MEKDSLDVINPEEKSNVFSARLLHLDNDLTAAEVDRAGKEAAFNAVKGGSLPAAEASTEGEQLRTLEAKLNSETTKKFAESFRLQFGSTHPIYKKAASQVTELQWEIDVLRAAHRATRRHRLPPSKWMPGEPFAPRHDPGQAEFDQMNGRSFEYKALKQEADTDKALYEELIRKIREAGINASFESSSIRLADVARHALSVLPQDEAECFARVAGLHHHRPEHHLRPLDALDTTVVDSEHLCSGTTGSCFLPLPVGKFTDGHSAHAGATGRGLPS